MIISEMGLNVCAEGAVGNCVIEEECLDEYTGGKDHTKVGNFTHDTLDTAPNLRREKELRRSVSLDAKCIIVAIGEFIESRRSRKGLSVMQRGAVSNVGSYI